MKLNFINTYYSSLFISPFLINYYNFFPCFPFPKQCVSHYHLARRQHHQDGDGEEQRRRRQRRRHPRSAHEVRDVSGPVQVAAVPPGAGAPDRPLALSRAWGRRAAPLAAGQRVERDARAGPHATTLAPVTRPVCAYVVRMSCEPQRNATLLSCRAGILNLWVAITSWEERV